MIHVELILAVFGNAIAMLLFAIFITAGLSKLTAGNRDYYVRAINNYDILPNFLVPRLIPVIGSLEVVIALLLVLPMTQPVGLILASSLLFVYSVAFAKQIRQGKADTDCGCAGPGANIKISPLLLVRNLALIVIAVFSLVNHAPLALINWLIVLPLATMFGLLYLSSEQLIANRQKIQRIVDSQ